MSVKSIQVTMTGSAVPIVSVSTRALWIQFQNNAAAVIRIADSNVSTTQGIALSSGGGGFFVPPPSPRAYTLNDLLGWQAVGTNTQKLDIVYDDGQ